MCDDFICPICKNNQYDELQVQIKTKKDISRTKASPKQLVSEISSSIVSLYKCSKCSIVFDNVDKFSYKKPEVKFLALTNTAKIPIKAHESDTGFDLFIDEDVTINSSHTVLVKTNICLNFPPHLAASIRPRSGFNSKGIFMSLGTIDNGYRGNLGIVIYNSTGASIDFKQGIKIAQLVFEEVISPELIKVDSFDEVTERNTNGFGSTGI